MSPRGRAATFTWSGGLSSVAVAGGLALGTGDRGSELAAVLQQLEGPSPTGGGPDPAGVSGPGGAGSDPGRAAGRWPCPLGAAAGWFRCAAVPWRSPGVGRGGRAIEGVSSLQCCNCMMVTPPPVTAPNRPVPAGLWPAGRCEIPHFWGEEAADSPGTAPSLADRASRAVRQQRTHFATIAQLRMSILMNLFVFIFSRV